MYDFGDRGGQDIDGAQLAGGFSSPVAEMFSYYPSANVSNAEVFPYFPELQPCMHCGMYNRLDQVGSVCAFSDHSQFWLGPLLG